MQQDESLPASLPRPLDNGQVAQTLVEYLGLKHGAFTIRGPSRKEYRFAAGRLDRLQYVVDEDLERFRLLPEFRVLDEARIDPESEIRRLWQEEITQRVVERMRDKHGQSVVQSARASGGRPSGKGFGALLDCWMSCSQLADCLGSTSAAYDAIADYWQNHQATDINVPPRQRFPAVRSDAKRKRQSAGRCLWYRHSEPIPAELGCR